MKRIFILLIISGLWFSLSAQELSLAKQLIREYGLPVVCDSCGTPCGEITVFDDGVDYLFEGRALVEITTKGDLISIDSCVVKILYRKGEGMISDARLSSYIQGKVRNALYKGYIVYPEKGEWSIHASRHHQLMHVNINVSCAEKP